MKNIFILLSLLLGAASLRADPGTINLHNTAFTTIHISNILTGEFSLMPKTAGGFRFQLFIAPAGTTDRAQFTGTDIFATNMVIAAGRLFGGSGVQVAGVQAAETRAILLRGWSSGLGENYETALANWNPFANGYLGESAIAPDFFFGGWDGTGPIPASPAFGGAHGIQSGFTLVGVPEPAIATLLLVGSVAVKCWRRRLDPEASERIRTTKYYR